MFTVLVSVMDRSGFMLRYRSTPCVCVTRACCAFLQQDRIGEHQRVRDQGLEAQREEQGPREADEHGPGHHGEALGAEADLYM